MYSPLTHAPVFVLLFQETDVMEYMYLFFFLLHILSTSSLIIPNSDITSKSKRLTLRSIDPLTRRSPAERNFIRFGRSVLYESERLAKHPEPSEAASNHKINLNKREALHFSNENADHDFATDATDDFTPDQLKQQSDRSSNLLCLVPDEDSGDHMLCMGPQQNVSSQFYVVADQEEESLSPNQTDRFLRYARSSADSDRIRKSKSGNFMRLGRSSKFSRGMFSRYDRGRDNFMRLGRSGDDNDLANTKRKHDSFMRLGRTSIDEYSRPSRKHDSFMRLGRDSELGALDDGYARNSRGRDNFMRLGRMVDDSFDHDVMRIGRTDPDEYNRYSRKYDSFMRLGRTPDDQFDQSVRQSDNFMRLARPSDDGLDRSLRRQGNFMRLGRMSNDAPKRSVKRNPAPDSEVNPIPNDPPPPPPWEIGAKREFIRSGRRHDNFMRLGRVSDDAFDQIVRRQDDSFRMVCDQERNEPTVKWLDQEKRSKAGNFMRLGRSVQRISRSVGEERETDNTNEVEHSHPRLLGLSTEAASEFQEFTKAQSEGSDSDQAKTNDNSFSNNFNSTKSKWRANADPSIDKVVSDGSGDANEDFVRETRRRGLYLRFGRSEGSRTTSFDKKCEGYQCTASKRTAANSLPSPLEDSAAKSNVL